MSQATTAIRRDRKGQDHVMTLIGQWDDLALYYSGPDGNAWSYNRCTSSWVNDGDLDTFRERFKAGRYRGKLFD